MDETNHLLKDLTEAHGVPGYEGPVCEIVCTNFQPLSEILQVHIGSLICRKEGNAVIHRDDYDQAARLLTELLKRLDAATVADLKA